MGFISESGKSGFPEIWINRFKTIKSRYIQFQNYFDFFDYIFNTLVLKEI
jgi:hypothetical protein